LIAVSPDNPEESWGFLGWYYGNADGFLDDLIVSNEI
jgi:hypothetical protein